MNREPLNRNSFIRHYADSNGIALPVVGKREPDRYSPALILCPGESYTIYLNSDVTLSDSSLSDGITSYAISLGMTPITTTIGTHRVVVLSIPEGIPDGVYVIPNGDYTTNPFEVINDLEEARQISALVRFGHNSILGNFYYPYVSPTFVQQVRLRCTLSDHQSDVDMENYQQTNDGQIQSLAGIVKEYIILRTPDLSKDDHGAVRFLSLCDKLRINQRLYHRKAENPYRITPVMDSAGYDGEFGVYDTDATVLLRC